MNTVPLMFFLYFIITSKPRILVPFTKCSYNDNRVLFPIFGGKKCLKLATIKDIINISKILYYFQALPFPYS